MGTKRKIIFIYNFTRTLSLILSFFLFFSPMYADSQIENDRSSIRIEDVFFKEGSPVLGNFVKIALREVNITTVSQLTSMTEEELFESLNYGMKNIVIRVLKKELEKNNYSLSSTSSELGGILFTKGRRTPRQKRILNKLIVAEIRTVRHLVSLNKEKIYDILRSRRSIRVLQEDITQLGKMREEEFYGRINSNRKRILKQWLESRDYSFLPSTELEDIFFKEGWRTPFQIRILKDLKNAGITTLGQLESKTEAELLQIPYIEEASVKTLQEEMENLKNKCMNAFKSISKKRA